MLLGKIQGGASERLPHETLQVGGKGGYHRAARQVDLSSGVWEVFAHPLVGSKAQDSSLAHGERLHPVGETPERVDAPVEEEQGLVGLGNG